MAQRLKLRSTRASSRGRLRDMDTAACAFLCFSLQQQQQQGLIVTNIQQLPQPAQDKAGQLQLLMPQGGSGSSALLDCVLNAIEVGAAPASQLVPLLRRVLDPLRLPFPKVCKISGTRTDSGTAAAKCNSLGAWLTAPGVDPLGPPFPKAGSFFPCVCMLPVWFALACPLSPLSSPAKEGFFFGEPSSQWSPQQALSFQYPTMEGCLRWPRLIFACKTLNWPHPWQHRLWHVVGCASMASCRMSMACCRKSMACCRKSMACCRMRIYGML